MACVLRKPSRLYLESLSEAYNCSNALVILAVVRGRVITREC
jgi:hypothetical protein